MRTPVRILALWSVTLSLLAGLCLPLAARVDQYDSDGICGPALIAPGTAAKVDVATSAPSRGHCLFCHLRHDMAGAFVSSLIQITLASDAGRMIAGRPMAAPGDLAIGQTAPRGPPARS